MHALDMPRAQDPGYAPRPTATLRGPRRGNGIARGDWMYPWSWACDHDNDKTKHKTKHNTKHNRSKRCHKFTKARGTPRVTCTAE